MSALKEMKEILVEPFFNQALSNTMRELPQSDKVKPFVKWAGGKRSLIKEILPRLPESFNHYYEPFVGGGALFFALNPQQATLSDLNLDLIITYAVIKNKPKELMALLEKHKRNHGEEYYYRIRKQFTHDNDLEVAARFIYLNKTCYNGLYRVNGKGEFNVPIGSYKEPLILDEINIIACHKVLQNVDIKYQNYSIIKPKKGDFVYIDPPYHPINDNSFTKYTKLDFTEADQIKLFEFCKELNMRNVYFMLSNSNSEFIRKLYKDFDIETVSAPRNINCKPSSRQGAKEVIVRNYKTWERK